MERGEDDFSSTRRFLDGAKDIGKIATTASLGVATLGSASYLVSRAGKSVGKSEAVGLTKRDVELRKEDYGIEDFEDLTKSDFILHPWAYGKFEGYEESLEANVESGYSPQTEINSFRYQD